MSRLRSIAAELGLTFLVVALAPILTAYVVANDIFSRSIHEQKLEALTAIADAAQDRVETYVRGLITDTTTLARVPDLVELLRRPEPLIQPDVGTLSFLSGFSEAKGYYDLLLVDQAGTIRFSLKREDDLGGHVQDAQLAGTQLAATLDAANTLLQTEVSNFAWYPPSQELAAFLAAPIFDDGVIIGNLVMQIDNQELNAIVNHYGGLGETGELLAATLGEDGLVVAAPSRHAPDLPERTLDPAAFAPLQAAMQGQAGSGRFVDYRGQDSLGVWRYLPSLNWGLLVKIDTAEFQAPIQRFARISQAVMLASVGLVLFGVWLANRLVSRPIVQLAQSVTRLEHETLPERLQVPARHEIAALVAAFDHLIASVRVHQTELEARVAQRTAELAEANRELQHSNIELATTLDTLQKTQSQLVESEKLVALGQLIAGVAHEINTPLGSIASSIETLTAAYQEQDRFLALFATLSPLLRERFLELLTLAAAGSNLSLKEKRDLKKDYEKRLAGRAVPQPRQVADLLSQLPPLEIERFVPLLEDEKAAAILEHLRQGSHIHRACQNIRTAADKARKVVFALKSFARYDHTGVKTPTNLRESIETILTLYHNQMKQAIDLQTDLPEEPPIPAYADELGQVWMNLVHNALQAMDYKGRLEIGLRQDADWARVRITDSGCGIPEAIRERIFQPFFTTKPAGEGSGLGLDIVRRIVDKHQGEIRLESTVGVGTRVEVWLPVKGME
jgi:two-component system, NtrC family, sensor kinase